MQPTEVAYMTTAEVANLFEVNPRTIRRWAADGHLHAVQPGNKLLFPVEQLRIQHILRARGQLQEEAPRE